MWNLSSAHGEERQPIPKYWHPLPKHWQPVAENGQPVAKDMKAGSSNSIHTETPTQCKYIQVNSGINSG